MDLSHYKKALQAARSEMEELLRHRADIDKRLSRLNETMNALSTLLGVYRQRDTSSNSKISVGHLGITDAIRKILEEAGAPMKPPAIKAQLLHQGFDIGEYANPLAVIHNTLRRLGLQGELIIVKNPAGQIAYAISKERNDPLTARNPNPEGLKKEV